MCGLDQNIYAAIAGVLLVAGCGAQMRPNGGCLNPNWPPGVSTTTIDITKEIANPHFIYANDPSTYLIFLPVGDVQSELEHLSKRLDLGYGPLPAERNPALRLLNRISANPPKSDDTYLSSYDEDGNDYGLLQGITADLLEQGRAAVANGPDDPLSTVRMLREKSSRGSGRRFFDKNGNFILVTSECIGD